MSAYDSQNMDDAHATQSGVPVKLWHVRLPDCVRSRDCAALDGRERARAEAIGDPARRRQYLASRIIMRRVLAEELGRAASDLQFTAGPHGRPALACGSGPSFNLSHSGAHAALAVCHAATVGVDMEEPRPLHGARRIARRFFAPEEWRALENLDENAFDNAFRRLWMLKEAYIKADGRGFACSLRDFAIDHSRVRMLRCNRRVPGRVMLAYKSVGSGLDTALAVLTDAALRIECEHVDMRDL